jgi:hypothetical protein
MAYFQEALKALRPDKEFSTFEDNAVVVWHDKKVIPPTQDEIEAKIEELKTAETNAATEKAAAKAALLERLGITEEEAKLLLG